MPTYPYLCRSCGHELEEFQSITEAPLTHCPRCDTESLVRVLGAGAGLIFKGSGFYLTDYKKGSTPPAPAKKGERATGGDAGSKGTSAPAGDTPPAKKDAEKKEGS